MKLLFRKKPQDIEGMDVAAWTKLFHATEEQVDGIVGSHELLHVFDTERINETGPQRAAIAFLLDESLDRAG
jgi:hypothetical protein